MTGSCDWNDLQPEFAVQPPLSVHLRSPTTSMPRNFFSQTIF